METEQVFKYVTAFFAVVGALCSIARVIVALTPTPKDDEVLEKVSTQLRAIAKVFGLDMKQGRNK